MENMSESYSAAAMQESITTDRFQHTPNIGRGVALQHMTQVLFCSSIAPKASLTSLLEQSHNTQPLSNTSSSIRCSGNPYLYARLPAILPRVDGI